MFKYLKVSALSVLLLAGIFAGCTRDTIVNYSASAIRIYPGRAVLISRNYTSKGQIFVEDSSLDFASLFWGYTYYNQGSRHGSVDVGPEVVEKLQEHLISEAQSLGANAVVDVVFGIREIPILIPGLGPLTKKTFFAKGEAVQL